MTYELAKQLKDAGFPKSQFRREDGCICMDYTVETHGTWVCTHPEEYRVYVPTLSELISACGLPFALECFNNGEKWYASRVVNDNEVYTGDTPEEAVANLWLALNKKDAQTTTKMQNT